MKGKLGLLALLSLIVTVGGVYATWTFAEGNTSTAETTVNVGMTGVEHKGAKGTLAVMIMGDGGYSLAVDDADNNHKPDIKTAGVVTVTFKPADDAPDAVKTEGIDVKLYVTYASKDNTVPTLDAWTYDGTQIFDIGTTADNAIHLDNADATYADGVFTWTVSHTQIDISLHEGFDDKVIDTQAKYDALNAELNKGSFKLMVEECSNHA